MPPVQRQDTSQSFEPWKPKLTLPERSSYGDLDHGHLYRSRGDDIEMKRNLENRRKRMVKQETLHQIKFEAALQNALLERSEGTKGIASISTTGHSFTIHDQKQFAKLILPQILTNSKHFPSFVRLMLKYGFKRTKNKNGICFHRLNFITQDALKPTRSKASKRS